MSTPTPKPEQQTNDLTGTLMVNDAGRIVVTTDRPHPSINVSRETIESIKRTLYNAIDKLERMASE
jgi:hypothetical protein